MDASEMGRKGGRNRMARMTKQERQAFASLGGRTRWRVYHERLRAAVEEAAAAEGTLAPRGAGGVASPRRHRQLCPHCGAKI
jgi:hypothetical protein